MWGALIAIGLAVLVCAPACDEDEREEAAPRSEETGAKAPIESLEAEVKRAEGREKYVAQARECDRGEAKSCWEVGVWFAGRADGAALRHGEDSEEKWRALRAALLANERACEGGFELGCESLDKLEELARSRGD